MQKYVVCKTVVPYGQMTEYLVFAEDRDERPAHFGRLAGLVAWLRRPDAKREPTLIKTDLPGDLYWLRDGDKVQGDTVMQCARLDRDDMRELVRLLRQ